MRDFFALVKRMAEPALKYKGLIFINIFYRVSLIISGILVADRFGHIVDATTRGAPFSAILNLGLQTLGITLFSLGLMFFMTSRNAAYPNLAARIAKTIRENILTEYFRRQTLSHEATGKTLSVFENGLNSWEQLSMRLTIEDPINISSFFVGFTYLLFLNVKLFPIVLIYMITIVTITILAQKYLRPIRTEQRKIREERSRAFVRSIMEKKTIVFHNAFDYEQANLEKYQGAFVETVDRGMKIGIPVYRFPQILLDIIRIVIACIVAYEVLHGGGTIIELVTSGIVFGLIDRYFQGIIDSYQVYTEQYITLKRLWDFLDESPVFTRLHEGNIFTPKSGNIEFKNVTYAYSENKEVLNNFSLTFTGGKKIALVGRSGAGKTTIIKIILGLLEPKKGEIIIDGQNLMETRLDSYFPYIGYLSQDPSVFDGTVRENLTYGLNEEVDDARLFTALNHARCDFVQHFELGLMTEIGEKGVKLSGGERQRLAIARIFLRNPEILILDEPTSALDSFSEVAITEALQELFQNKTVIIVAHRLNLVG